MRLLFDEDFNQRIVRGLLRRAPTLDYRSAHDADLAGLPDDAILAAAATEERLLVSHDVTTMSAAFKVRLERGEALTGLLLVPQRLPVGAVVADLELICAATDLNDWRGLVEYLPLGHD